MIIGTVVDAKLFTWFKGAGVAEISDFKGREQALFGRLYDDACDQGFRCIGRDGGIIPFALEYEHRSPEGEIEAWVFRPVNRQLREAGVRINLFND